MVMKINMIEQVGIIDIHLQLFEVEYQLNKWSLYHNFHSLKSFSI